MGIKSFDQYLEVAGMTSREYDEMVSDIRNQMG